MKIAVIDPCKDNARILAMLLECEGHQVQVASLETIRACDPADVVITELTNQWESHRVIHEAMPNARIIFHTAEGRPEFAQISKALHCPHFVKPAGEELVKFIKTSLVLV